MDDKKYKKQKKTLKDILVILFSGDFRKARRVSNFYLKRISINVMEWFTANIGYHHIHHLNAAIPFYKLPKAYHAIPELKIEKDTTLHPFDILKCLKLKVWDPESNKTPILRLLPII